MGGFKKAKPMQAAIKMAMYGSPGTGKTFTALLLAEGIAKYMGKRVAFVDTEQGTDFYAMQVPQRRIHPDPFEFDAMYTRSIAEVLSAVRSLSPSEYGVVVIDSITHLWESAIAAYSGKKTKFGGIPMQAWGRIKAPYKDLMTTLLNSTMHVIVCGREGTEYASDSDSDELKAIGPKMKAEGETPYEPHILARMVPERHKDGSTSICVYFQKDRTGVLAGQTITLYTPDGRMSKTAAFDLIAKPLLGLLGKEQAQVAGADETAAKDSEAFDKAETEKQHRSAELREEFEARFKLCKTLEEVEALSKTITPDVKRSMHAEDVKAVRGAYQAARAKAKGEAPAAREAADESDPTDGDAP